MLTGDTSKIELEFWCFRFRGEGKTGVPGEKPLGARTRSNNNLNPHMTPSSGVSAICETRARVLSGFFVIKALFMQRWDCGSELGKHTAR